MAEIDIKTNGNRERSLKFMGNNAGTFKNKNTAATFSWPSYAICQTTLFPLPTPNHHSMFPIVSATALHKVEIYAY